MWRSIKCFVKHHKRSSHLNRLLSPQTFTHAKSPTRWEFSAVRGGRGGFGLILRTKRQTKILCMWVSTHVADSLRTYTETRSPTPAFFFSPTELPKVREVEADDPDIRGIVGNSEKVRHHRTGYDLDQSADDSTFSVLQLLRVPGNNPARPMEARNRNEKIKTRIRCFVPKVVNSGGVETLTPG